MNISMPTFILNTNYRDIDPVSEQIIHEKVRGFLSRVINKSEQYVLTIINSGINMNFGTKSDHCAYCEVKNVGSLKQEQTEELSDLICKEIYRQLNISSQRIYIEFQESERHMWGWDKKTFAS